MKKKKTTLVNMNIRVFDINKSAVHNNNELHFYRMY